MAVAIFQCKKCDQRYAKWYKTDKHIPEARMCPDCTGMSYFVKIKTQEEIAKTLKKSII